MKYKKLRDVILHAAHAASFALCVASTIIAISALLAGDFSNAFRAACAGCASGAAYLTLPEPERTDNDDDDFGTPCLS